MSEIVFILGAGASKHAGAPLMNEFLDTAEALCQTGKLGEHQDDFDRVFEAIGQLQVVQSKAPLDLDNLESVFGAFEMGRLIGRLPGLPKEQIDGLLDRFRRVIARTLEETMTFPFEDGHLNPHGHYDMFARLVEGLDENGSRRRCSIITFNYDVGLDYALHHCRYPPNYCLEPRNQDTGATLLKLHGSLNWGRCEECATVFSWDLHTFFQNQVIPPQPKKQVGIKLRMATQFEKRNAHCPGAKIEAPFLVPPTWNKAEYHSNLARVWRRAARELSEAERIFVCGYSLAETDSFFRYLFSLGVVGPARIKRFWLIDPSPSSDVENRFKKLLGPTTHGRFKRDKQPFEFIKSAVALELKQTIL